MYFSAKIAILPILKLIMIDAVVFVVFIFIGKYTYLKDMTDGVRYEICVYPYVKENGVNYIK